MQPGNWTPCKWGGLSVRKREIILLSEERGVNLGPPNKWCLLYSIEGRLLKTQACVVKLLYLRVKEGIK
jgi:hypothetical protein